MLTLAEPHPGAHGGTFHHGERAGARIRVGACPAALVPRLLSKHLDRLRGHFVVSLPFSKGCEATLSTPAMLPPPPVPLPVRPVP